MVINATFGQYQEIVNAGSKAVMSVEQAIHLFLEDSGAIAESHGDSLVFIFAER